MWRGVVNTTKAYFQNKALFWELPSMKWCSLNDLKKTPTTAQSVTIWNHLRSAEASGDFAPPWNVAMPCPSSQPSWRKFIEGQWPSYHWLPTTSWRLGLWAHQLVDISWVSPLGPCFTTGKLFWCCFTGFIWQRIWVTWDKIGRGTPGEVISTVLPMVAMMRPKGTCWRREVLQLKALLLPKLYRTDVIRDHVSCVSLFGSKKTGGSKMDPFKMDSCIEPNVEIFDIVCLRQVVGKWNGVWSQEAPRLVDSIHFLAIWCCQLPRWFGRWAVSRLRDR